MPTDDAMVLNSPVIVYGEVLGTAPGPAGERPSTDASLRVDDVLKGTVPGDTLVVRQPGGIGPNGRATRILGLPMLAEGDRVLLFLRPAGGEAYRTVQLGLGIFFETSTRNRPLLVRDSFDHLELELPDAAEADTRRRSRQPREAGAFRRWIRDRAAGVERAPDYFAVDLPEGPAVVASPYALLGSDGTSCEEGGLPLRHRSGTDIGFVVHGSQQGLTNTGGLIGSAMAAWNAVERSTATMTVSSTSTATFSTVLDGKNSIGFEDPNGEIEGFYDPAAGGGLLAAAFYSYDCGTTTPPHTTPISGTRAYELREVDIVTQDGFHRFLSSSEQDTNGERFEAVIGHELGHALGLGHSGFSDALMRSVILDPDAGALLHTDDKRAVRSLYPTAVAVSPRAVAEAPDVSWVTEGLRATWANVVTGAAEDPTGYDLVYEATAPHSGGVVASIFAEEDYPGNPPHITATLVGLLDRCKSYRVAIVSTNDAGRGDWSPYGSAPAACTGPGPPPPAGPGPPPPAGPAPPPNSEDPLACERRSAPYWSGPTGGFTVRPAPGRNSVSLTCGGRTTEYMAEDGIVTRLVESSCRRTGLEIAGAAPGGWYWQHGDRNAAVAPLVCSEALGGPSAVVPGGVTADATDGGTLIRHDTAQLIGIVPHLEGNECAEYVTPYWQGDGGVVVRPAEGRETVRVRVQCGRTYSTMTPSAGEDGVIAELVEKSYCTDHEGNPKQGRLTVTGAASGGWYWIRGEANAAVSPLMCADLLGGPGAVDPGGVVSRAAEDGTYFKHDTSKLIGVVPHLVPNAEDD